MSLLQELASPYEQFRRWNLSWERRRGQTIPVLRVPGADVTSLTELANCKDRIVELEAKQAELNVQLREAQSGVEAQQRINQAQQTEMDSVKTALTELTEQIRQEAAELQQSATA